MINPIEICMESTFNSSYTGDQSLIGLRAVAFHMLPAPLDTDVVSGCLSKVTFELNQQLHTHIKFLLISKVKQFMIK